MTRREFVRLVSEAEKARFPNDFAFLAGNAADIIRDYPRPVLSKDGAMALIRWQSLNLNGTWDEGSLNETFLFMRGAIVDDPGKGEEIKVDPLA